MADGASGNVPRDANEGESRLSGLRWSTALSSRRIKRSPINCRSVLFVCACAAGCPGVASDAAGKSDSCAGCPNQAACASGAGKQVDPAVALVAERLASVKHKILVLSGKGGVGKSTFSAQLAFTLAARGRSVGLLDIDICGPSIPRMLGLVGQKVHQSASGWSPVWLDDNLGVMSIGFMLPDQDGASHGLKKRLVTALPEHL
jgi:hypothetical protein